MRHFYLFILCILSGIFAYGQEIATIDRIKYYLENGEATIMIQDKNLSGSIVIPETISHNGTDYIVTNVDGSAFLYTKIKSIILPNSITSLGDECFYGCI